MARDLAERGLTRVIGVGAPAGGLDALINIVRALPADLPAAICMGRSTDLDVRVPKDGEMLQPGRVYVAPPDRHLTVSGGRLELGRGPN